MEADPIVWLETNKEVELRILCDMINQINTQVPVSNNPGNEVLYLRIYHIMKAIRGVTPDFKLTVHSLDIPLVVRLETEGTRTGFVWSNELRSQWNYRTLINAINSIKTNVPYEDNFYLWHIGLLIKRLRYLNPGWVLQFNSRWLE
jgi:hypothetical protein